MMEAVFSVIDGYTHQTGLPQEERKAAVERKSQTMSRRLSADLPNEALCSGHFEPWCGISDAISLSGRKGAVAVAWMSTWDWVSKHVALTS